MRNRYKYIGLTLMTVLFTTACTEQVDTGSTYTDGYDDVKEVAWEFIEEKGWSDSADKDWQSTKVEKKIADKNFELIDNTYEGKEVLSISFADRVNTVIGTPVILVSPDTNEVIGYIPSE